MNTKNFIKEKLNEALNEDQIFDFEGTKSTIFKFIDAVKEKRTPWPFAYNLIRNKGLVGDDKKLGFTDDQIAKWDKIFRSKPFYTDGAWSEVGINLNTFPKKSGNNRTFNYYVTISKDVKNIGNFVKGINDLNKKLYALSNEKKSPLAWKTHLHLSSFVGDNDSMKVYYYDGSLKNDVEKTIKDWITQNNIKIGNRTHVHGVDAVIDPNDKKKSFGEILAAEVEKQFTKVIQQFGDKYTNEQYYQWLKKHLPEIIKKAKINYN